MAIPVAVPVVGGALLLGAAALRWRAVNQGTSMTEAAKGLVPGASSGVKVDAETLRATNMTQSKFDAYVKGAPDTILNLPGHPLNGQKVSYAVYHKAMLEDEAKQAAARIAAGLTKGNIMRATKDYPDFPDGLWFEFADMTPGKNEMNPSDLAPTSKSVCILWLNVVQSGLQSLGLPPGSTLVECTDAPAAGNRMVAGYSLDPRIPAELRQRKVLIPMDSIQGVTVV